MEQHGGQQAALVSMGDAPMSGGSGDQLLLESQTIMAEHLSLMEQHNGQQAISASMVDAPMLCGSGDRLLLESQTAMAEHLSLVERHEIDPISHRDHQAEYFKFRNWTVCLVLG